MNAFGRVRTFLFAPESPRPLALVRIGMGAVLLGYFSARWPFAVELYSQAGQPMPLFPGTWWEPPALGPQAAIVIHSALLFALLTVTIGWRTRTSLVLALVLSTWLGLLDSPGTFKKYSAIALHVLLLLTVSKCGAAWSVDRFVSPDRRQLIELGAAWPRRLMQLFVCSVYWGAAITKLRLPDYANGDLLMFSLLDDQWGSRGWGLWLATQPRLLTLLSLATVFFEIAFPLLVWTRLRPALVAAAVGFHLSVGTALDLSIFSPVMIVAIGSFLTDGDLQRMTGFTRCIGRPFRFDRGNDSDGPRGAWPLWNPGMQRPEHTDKTPAEGLFDGVNCDSRHGQNSMKAADPTTSPDASPHEFFAPARRRLAGVRLGLVLFAAAGVCVAAAGLAAQFRSDPYGVFHRREPDALVELAPLEVERMLAGQLPAYEDYFHRIEIGSRVANTHAFGEHKTFRPGMVVYVVARLIRIHPAMRLEGVLIAPDGQDVGRFEHNLDSSHSHAINGFHLTNDLPAGRYRILLQADGYRVAQKTFQLNSVPDDAADAAG